jgi:hypothetical protein
VSLPGAASGADLGMSSEYKLETSLDGSWQGFLGKCVLPRVSRS